MAFKHATGYQQSVLYSFHGGTDGALSYAGVIAVNGALFGTTLHGGVGSGGFGTVYKLLLSGSGASESPVYAFGGAADGQYPYGGVVADAQGNLYGTTFQGGSVGPGTVFELTPNGSGYTKTTIHSFQAGADGANPYGNLVVDNKGALYGTTVSGGASSGSDGIVFKLTPTPSGYTEQILHAFQGGSTDGANPYAGLLLYKGALYGTTLNGGRYNTGTVFKISRRGTGYSVIYALQASPDANHPYGGVIADGAGALYGTSSQGGATNGGTVFKLTPSGSGSTYTESLLYTFTGCGFSLDGDGCDPQASLLMDSKCDLFGTTLYGGSIGQGAVFELVPSQPRAPRATCPAGQSYTDDVLYSFSGGSDGKNPEAGLIRLNGSLYSTTFYGGASGEGTVFELQKVRN